MFDLSIELRRRRRILVLEGDRGVRVHVGEAVHERHDVRAMRARRAGAREDVAVARCVDHEARENCLAPRFRFHHDAAHRAVLDDRA